MTHHQTHTHTHTHTQRETQRLADGKREADTGERMASDPRQHSGTVPDPPQREARRKKQLSQGRGRQPWARAPAGRGALGLAEPRGVPKTSWQPRSQRCPSAWLPKARPRPAQRPEGEWVSVCVSVSVGKGVGRPTGVRGDTQNGGGRVWSWGVAYHVGSKHTGRSSRFLQSECGVALRPRGSNPGLRWESGPRSSSRRGAMAVAIHK